MPKANGKGPKLIKLPRTERCLIMDTEEFTLTVYFKPGTKATNANINWALDRGKKALHE